jgi:hypothetical protein
MNLVSAGVKSGIMTPNEAREYLNIAKIEGADELVSIDKSAEPIPGSGAQDTGGGGGNQTRRMNIGAK